MTLFPKQFDIALSDLKIGKHTFNYTIGDDFFNRLDFSDIKQGKAKIDLILEKQTELLFLAEIKISSVVILPCDYCSDPLELPLEHAETLRIELSEDTTVVEEHPVDLWCLPANINTVNVGQWIYEIICSNVPFQRIHTFNCRGEQFEQKLYPDKRWDKLKELLK